MPSPESSWSQLVYLGGTSNSLANPVRVKRVEEEKKQEEKWEEACGNFLSYFSDIAHEAESRKEPNILNSSQFILLQIMVICLSWGVHI